MGSTIAVTMDDVNTHLREDAFWIQKMLDGSYIVELSVINLTGTIKKDSFEDGQAMIKVESDVFGDNYIPMIPWVGTDDLEDKCSLKIGDGNKVLTTQFRCEAGSPPQLISIKEKTIGIIELLNFEDANQRIEKADQIGIMLGYANNAAQILRGFRMNAVLKKDNVVFKENSHTSKEKTGRVIMQELVFAANHLNTEIIRKECIKILCKDYKHDTGVLKFIASENPTAPVALGYSSYGYFTCPARRYIDTVNQRILLAAIQGNTSLYKDELHKIAHSISVEYERRSNDKGLSSQYIPYKIISEEHVQSIKSYPQEIVECALAQKEDAKLNFATYVDVQTKKRKIGAVLSFGEYLYVSTVSVSDPDLLEKIYKNLSIQLLNSGFVFSKNGSNSFQKRQLSWENKLEALASIHGLPKPHFTENTGLANKQDWDAISICLIKIKGKDIRKRAESKKLKTARSLASKMAFEYIQQETAV